MYVPTIRNQTTLVAAQNAFECTLREEGRTPKIIAAARYLPQLR
jgi:hypothetical protein